MSVQKLGWQDRINISAMFDSRMFSIESKCEFASLYKYLHFPDPSALSAYFSKTTLKFATKVGLNDPFDLTRRWEKFGSAPTIDFVTKFIKDHLEKEFSDNSTLVRHMVEDPRFKQSGQSVAALYALVGSGAGQAFIAEAKKTMMSELPKMMNVFFQQATASIDVEIEKKFHTVGLLSLTEEPLNRAMWGLYAGSGDGFALELDPNHSFFLSKRDDGSERNRLMRVMYTDDRWDDFWQNPLSLFAVKNVEFSFEREWRMVCDTKSCRRVDTPAGPLFLLDAPLGLIKRVIFGHRVTEADALEHFATIKKFDAHVDVARVTPNVSSGSFEVIPLAIR